MLREILTIGDKIDIKPLDKNGKPLHNTRVFASQLVDFVDFDIINISTPIVYSRAIPLTSGENYNLCFYTSKGLYQCNCVAINNFKEDNTIISSVRVVTNPEKLQRRQFYRLECLLDIEYRCIQMEEETLRKKLIENNFLSSKERDNCIATLNKLEEEWAKATITNLSGGGAKFNTTTRLNQSEKLCIKMELPKETGKIKLELDAIVIASEKIIIKSNSYENRVQFIKINPRDREELIKYIFELDRKKRKNK